MASLDRRQRAATPAIRPAWKARLGWIVWTVVATLVLFEVANRMWLDWYHVSELQAWDRWHDLPKAPTVVAGAALVLLGVWTEAGRIDETPLRWAVRIIFVVAPILTLALLVILSVAFSGVGMT